MAVPRIRRPRQIFSQRFALPILLPMEPAFSAADFAHGDLAPPRIMMSWR